MTFKKLTLAAALASVSFGANAATIISGTSLQSGLDAATNGLFYDVNTSQHTPDEVFKIEGLGSVAALMFEFSSFATSNVFGMYDVTDTSNQLVLFDGVDAAGARVSIFETATGGVQFDIYGPASTNGNSATFNTANFGYFLNSPEGTFYSQASLNTDVADVAHNETTDHMVAFRGDDALEIDANGDGTYGVFGSSSYILAWEDKLFPNSDYDYSDMVVYVESVETVNESASLALFGSGLAGLGIARRKKAKA